MLVARRLASTFIQRGGHCGPARLFWRPHGAFPDPEPRYLQCTCCWTSRAPVAGLETLNEDLTASVPCSHDDASLDTCYTSDQRELILRTLNNATETELAGVKLLRGRKSVNIVEYRTKHGPFRDLESLVNVPLLKHKSALVVFHSILNPLKKEREKKLKVQLLKFIKPEVDRAWLEEASSIVSIICGVNRIAWAHVDRGMAVLDWQQQDCPNFLKGTYMASAYLNDISQVVSRLPSADFYLVEKPSISLQNSTLFPITAHMRSVEAMLFALLEPRTPQTGCSTPPKVLNMMRLAVGRHFGLMVGESRTSGAQAVRRMMTESVTEKIPRLTFPLDLLLRYRHAFQMGRRGGGEELCDALLQAVAFYELLGEASR